MRVIAKHVGFYAGERRRVGAEFEMSEAAMKKDKDGKPVLPRWVVPASTESRKDLADAKQAEADRALAAVKASRGPGKAGREVVKAGDPGDLV